MSIDSRSRVAGEPLGGGGAQRRPASQTRTIASASASGASDVDHEAVDARPRSARSPRCRDGRRGRRGPRAPRPRTTIWPYPSRRDGCSRHSAPASIRSSSSCATKPGVSTPSVGGGGSGPSPKITPRSSGTRARAAAMPAAAAGAAFSGMCRPAKTTTGSAGSGAGRVERAGVLALQHRHLSAHARLAQPARGHPREAERPLAHPHACPLDRPTDPAADRVRGTRASSRASTARASPPRARSGAADVRRPRRAGRSTGRTRCARRRSGGRGGAGARTRRPRRPAAAALAADPGRSTAPSAVRR